MNIINSHTNVFYILQNAKYNVNILTSERIKPIEVESLTEGVGMNPPCCFPGTKVPLSREGLFNGIFSVTNGMTLSQICDITGLEPAAVQNWIKRGYVNPAVNRKYSKGQVARIILIHMLREALVIEKVAKLLSYVNGDLLDRSDDIMDDSDIYDCLCRVLIEDAEEDGIIKTLMIGDLFNKIE